MPHRAQQIEDAMVARLNAVAAFTGNVDPWRVQSLSPDDAETPAVIVQMGESTPDSEYGFDNITNITSTLEVTVAIYAKAPSETEVRELVLEYVRLAHVALMADVQLGLPSVVSLIWPDGWDRPDVSATSDQITARMNTKWKIRYRTPFLDPA